MKNFSYIHLNVIVDLIMCFYYTKMIYLILCNLKILIPQFQSLVLYSGSDNTHMFMSTFITYCEYN